MCSIHLDDAMAAIMRQNTHQTPAYWWRGDRVMVLLHSTVSPSLQWGVRAQHRPQGEHWSH